MELNEIGRGDGTCMGCPKIMSNGAVYYQNICTGDALKNNKTISLLLHHLSKF
jgi:hypothetical protein